MARKSMMDVKTELEAAQQRELRARMRVQALKRRLTGEERRRATQQRCALGGVLLAMAARGHEEDMTVVHVVRRYLASSSASNAHASNVEALRGTPFFIDMAPML